MHSQTPVLRPAARWATLMYGAISYVIFLGVFLYALGFMANLIVPKTIDAPPSAFAWPIALAINAALLLLFGLQHSVMARPTFKRWWRQFVPDASERSTYVMFSNLALILLLIAWQPMPAIVWDVQQPLGRAILWALFAGGWGLVLVTTFLINHFDLFGLRQVWLAFRGRPYTYLKFVTPGPYKFVRHPLYVGWITAFWAIPTMTAGHLVFALGATAYILVAIVLEERNLIEYHGRDYIEYRARTGRLLPRLRPRQLAVNAIAES